MSPRTGGAPVVGSHPPADTAPPTLTLHVLTRLAQHAILTASPQPPAPDPLRQVCALAGRHGARIDPAPQLPGGHLCDLCPEHPAGDADLCIITTDVPELLCCVGCLPEALRQALCLADDAGDPNPHLIIEVSPQVGS